MSLQISLKISTVSDDVTVVGRVLKIVNSWRKISKVESLLKLQTLQPAEIFCLYPT